MSVFKIMGGPPEISKLYIWPPDDDFETSGLYYVMLAVGQLLFEVLKSVHHTIQIIQPTRCNIFHKFIT